MLLIKQELQEAVFVSFTCFVMKSVVTVNKQEAMTCRIARSSEILTCQDSFHLQHTPQHTPGKAFNQKCHVTT